MRVLVTGGAGFIGSHLADALIEAGHEVRVLDSLEEQVHGEPEDGPIWAGMVHAPSPEPPEYLNPAVDFMLGDVRDPLHVREALEGIDAVFHFAAAVGVGQSMYEVDRYVDVNSRGTAVLLEEVARSRVNRLIVASSMSVYGEGPTYYGPGPVPGVPVGVREDHLTFVGSPDGGHMNSVYALTKYDQEQLCLIVGKANGIPTTALRFFNVYGPRQALSNPYTGVIAIFASRLMNGKPPIIYEDGMQSRDFVSVYDVVRACMLALESEHAGVFNVGTGVATTVLDVARALGKALGTDIEPTITHKKRAGDIRHCFADISKARKLLGYKPVVTLDAGLSDLVAWLRTQTAVDSIEEAERELAERGLVG